MTLATRMLQATRPDNARAEAFFVGAERLPEKMSGNYVFRPRAPPQRNEPPRLFDKSEGSRYVWVHKGPQVSGGALAAKRGASSPQARRCPRGTYAAAASGHCLL